MGADFIVIANFFTAGGTEHGAALIAEAVLQEEWCAASGALTVESRRQDEINLLQLAFCFDVWAGEGGLAMGADRCF